MYTEDVNKFFMPFSCSSFNAHMQAYTRGLRSLLGDGCSLCDHECMRTPRVLLAASSDLQRYSTSSGYSGALLGRTRNFIVEMGRSLSANERCNGAKKSQDVRILDSILCCDNKKSDHCSAM
ncbi:PREDICTED: uncharacterized protein LOC108369307 isoform X2 [Rhagoletis zephyria]|uniref:uncharacterized protein LOC108369307 isoform X2 n=1 Tax=Rhagoletis zephyria TaxID=28612 RepID=UPI000811A879|nr:PREDICTED: uncharacterized protein LOC108369307 isoform X2 [Rhagoletis zephyria]